MSEYGHKLLFDENGIAVCPESRQTYQLSNHKVTQIK
jgi:UDP-2-acetamido-3-amino-2,3-dideoxy-glucuronate N-acetyltransferase